VQALSRKKAIAVSLSPQQEHDWQQKFDDVFKGQ
jgi:hypothetical protein